MPKEPRKDRGAQLIQSAKAYITAHSREKFSLQAVADALGAQVRFTCCDRRIAAALEGKVPDLFPLDIQRLYYFVQ